MFLSLCVQTPLDEQVSEVDFICFAIDDLTAVGRVATCYTGRKKVIDECTLVLRSDIVDVSVAFIAGAGKFVVRAFPHGACVSRTVPAASSEGTKVARSARL